jgi:hypothetical protein
MMIIYNPDVFHSHRRAHSFAARSFPWADFSTGSSLAAMPNPEARLETEQNLDTLIKVIENLP